MFVVATHLAAAGQSPFAPWHQGVEELSELLLAFGLSSIIGIERQLRGKSAGLRTQSIVATTAALLMLVSKYGFDDVLASGTVTLDPSRVASQIVSGVGFLGAGLIMTRRGTIRGLTTAASVWESASIGMAAGAGLAVLAVAVTILHFVIVVGYTRVDRWLSFRGHGERALTITYLDRRGVLRLLLAACSAHNWTVTSSDVVTLEHAKGGVDDESLVSVTLSLRGQNVSDAANRLRSVEGVVRIDEGTADDW